MRVNVSHLVLETPRDPNDQVVYEALDGSKGCDILARAVVKFNIDGGCIWSGEADGKMGKILDQLPFS